MNRLKIHAAGEKFMRKEQLPGNRKVKNFQGLFGAICLSFYESAEGRGLIENMGHTIDIPEVSSLVVEIALEVRVVKTYLLKAKN